MNHFGPNSEMPAAQDELSEQLELSQSTDPSQLETQDPETASEKSKAEERRARSNMWGFIFFMGAFMIYMFVQAVFFPSRGTAPT